MNDAVRAAIGARLQEKDMSRADLARAVNRTPQEISRALNGTRGGGSIPAIWTDVLDALGLTLAALPVEHVSGGPVILPSDAQALEREITARVSAAVRDALAQHAPAIEPGSAEVG
ncbi:helix-turn-helix domain-containing protein [Deinococcus arenicola]|uniref:Helix-turn-helix transcriptional regulator n=1 Tax=Deinococcus arenicola TaxID=2994950 RepID=A0ABU4DUL1_9DEIO|nr:helix-turn-helix transcriptional regulator [Deinococcus sp. ZS9-10]MDV6376107.1 helix-turn-helix transcriptional regulator [Deinococcus sp. ZS9-10]